jgi:HPt (histidine-containing phosphotransfer) domain-containing protein
MLETYLPEGSYKYEMKTDDSASDNKDGLISTLRNKGFNVDAAMTYCMNDESFLLELLNTFVNSEPEKRSSITGLYNDKNWADYSTYVHALKSSARTIGADKLSKLALEQENASKAQNVPSIISGFEGMMEEYAKVVEVLKNALDSNGAASDDDGDDDEVMEFLPE